MIESDKELSRRELSALVAEHLFGEPMPPIPQECPFDINHAEPSPKGHWQHIHVYENGDSCEWEPFPYGEDVEAAMQVVEKLGEGPWSVVMSSADERTDKEWFVEFIGSSKDGRYLLTGDGEADTLPEAICRAALAAIGSKE